MIFHKGYNNNIPPIKGKLKDIFLEIGISNIIITNINNILIAAVYTIRYIKPNIGKPTYIKNKAENANVKIKKKTDISIFLLNITINDDNIIEYINIFITFFFTLLCISYLKKELNLQELYS
jgi:hypothetical protein